MIENMEEWARGSYITYDHLIQTILVHLYLIYFLIFYLQLKNTGPAPVALFGSFVLLLPPTAKLTEPFITLFCIL